MKDSEKCKHLFVYGTLKKGECRSSFLDNSRFIGKRTLDGFVMFDTHFGYPAIVKGDGIVKGEVYEVSLETLLKLDKVENVPNLYKRHRTKDDLTIYLWAKSKPMDAEIIETFSSQ